MTRHHLVLFAPRSGSTLVSNWISQNLCDPIFHFYPRLCNLEINDRYYDYFLYNLKKMKDIDWCMKYQLSCGVTYSRSKVVLDKTDTFFEEVDVNNLHFCYRLNTEDTILSDLIAHSDRSYVVTGNKVLKRKKRHVDIDLAHLKCKGYELDMQYYNQYVQRYSNIYNSKFYCYENLSTIFDTEDDALGMKKQLGFEEKKDLIINYDEIIDVIKQYPFYHSHMNTATGELKLD